MRIVVGLFRSAAMADRAVKNLANAGLPPGRIRRLTSGSSEREIHSTIPTAETEQPGMGKAVGAVVGGVVGLTAALLVAAVLNGMGALGQATWIIAGVCGTLGAVIGGFAGGVLEERLSTGLPKDEIYFYEEALRRGRSVVLRLPSGSRQEETARGVLERAGSQQPGRGRRSWRVGLRRERPQPDGTASGLIFDRGVKEGRHEGGPAVLSTIQRRFPWQAR